MRTLLATFGFGLLATMIFSEKAATVVVNFLFAGIVPGTNARVEPLLVFLAIGMAIIAHFALRQAYRMIKKSKTTKKSPSTRRFTRLQA